MLFTSLWDGLIGAMPVSSLEGVTHGAIPVVRSDFTQIILHEQCRYFYTKDGCLLGRLHSF